MFILVISLTKYSSNIQNDVNKGFNDQSNLSTPYIPNTVHYVWCHNRTFRFEHFLSVLSTWKVLKPTEIIIHTIHNIGTDDTEIGWFDTLMSRVPVIKIQKIPQNVSECCGVPYGVYLLEKNGGIFVSENTLIIENIVPSVKENFTIGLTLYGENVSYLVATKGDMHLQEVAFLDMHSNLAQRVFENPVYCSKSNKTKIFNLVDQTICIEMKYLDPVVTVRSNTTLGAIVRNLLYDTTEQVLARSLLPGEIPKLVHFVWFDDKNLTFMMYLSIRSVLTVLNPDKVFIHSDSKLAGDYSEKIIKDPRVEFLHREIPEFIFGRKLDFIEHKTDVVKLNILLEYGGIYLDWNIVSVQSIDDIIATGYDAIMNIGNNTREINNGVVMAKPDSHFLKYCLKSYIHYKGDRWPISEMEIRNKLSALYPGTIHYQQNLQIICRNNSKECKSLQKFQNGNVTSYGDFDWQRDTYFINFNVSETVEYTNETTLQEGRDFVAEVGQYIMDIPYENETILV
ncbi:hypothetical protein FSP39_004524 [Pinctada imbricata]|uniref:Glycosyltransferase n=1 Tax=Pinctada imbricata TaxID=66713 RepID=A0AA89BYP4_PINIB|nr:hypothetical protein FSP39_004524 [Pinctada imbricata]